MKPATRSLFAHDIEMLANVGIKYVAPHKHPAFAEGIRYLAEACGVDSIDLNSSGTSILDEVDELIGAMQ